MKPWKIKYQCEKCLHVFELKYRGWYTTTQCEKCGDIARMVSTIHKRNIAFNKYKDVTAFGTDENGRTVAVTKKGTRIDPKETRYNLDDDEFGWKATGHKVKGFERR